MTDSPIYVTQPALPPLEEFVESLESIWSSRRLTNTGPFHERFEAALASFLDVDEVVLCSNGTMALLLSLRALNLSGEVITTPYSFVATAHAIAWAGLTPVFADIDPETCNLDPDSVAAAIGPKTSAILPVHCYGNPCDVDRLGTLAQRHNLALLYDAAHSFGTHHQGTSVLQHGDLATLSFHATKPFNTFEGGAIVCHSGEMKKRLEYLRNFGFEDEVTVKEVGINGKLTEFQAALGLAQLKYFNQYVKERCQIARKYRNRLASIPGLDCVFPQDMIGTNHAYFPVSITESFPLGRDECVERFRNKGIFLRRYFFPLITDFSMYDTARRVPENLPIARSVADSVVCLPIYPGLKERDIDTICDYFSRLSNE